MSFTLTHSRLSFGQAVRAAKRTGSLRQYRRTSSERLAVVSGGTVLRYGTGYADHLPMEWMRPTEHDGATDAGDTQALRDRKWMVAHD